MIKLRQIAWVVTLSIVMGQAIGFVVDVRRLGKEGDVAVAPQVGMRSKATPFHTAASKQLPTKTPQAQSSDKTILGPPASPKETK